jgi:outer membrane protein OmpA-like peptidoglycan-associated protein
VDPSRLKSQGFGEANPIASNDTAEGRQQNRRVMLNRTDSCPN